MNASTIINNAITSSEISYLAPRGAVLTGYLVMPASLDSHLLDAQLSDTQPSSPQLPGIIICPEWWGVTEYVRERARQLAESGYVVLVVDIYGEGKDTADAAQAKVWMQHMLDNPELMLAHAKAGLDTLATQPEVDSQRLAAVGFCFGGKIALDLARAGYDLKAVVTFHGTLTAKTPAEAGKIKGELLVLHGADDTRVTMDKVEAFKHEMDAAQVNYQVIVYPHAKHAFTNPLADQRAAESGVDLGYNATADQQSNQAMLQLFERVLS